MSAYAIAQVEVTDADAYAKYMAAVPATIDQYGGRYIARGGDIEVVSGTLPFPRIVIIEFSSVQQASAWAHSPEYAEACRHKEGAAVGVLSIVPGVD